MMFLNVVAYFRQYPTGRRCTLVLDCSAFMWLFRGKDSSPKLHRWAVKLLIYNIVLQWKKATNHYMPHAMFPFRQTDAPQTRIESSISDYLSSDNPPAYAGSREPVLDGVLLDEYTPAGVDGHHDQWYSSALLTDTVDRSAKTFQSSNAEAGVIED